MQVKESGPSVLEYLSFEAEQTSQEMTTPRTAHRNGSSSSTGLNGSRSKMHMQGILWKRRDVFRNRWRQRWFVLHSDQRVLTYYLLANQDKEQVVSGGTSSTSSRRRRATAFGTSSPPSSISVGSAANSSHRDNENRELNRRRTLSESSSVSINTIDCDVVPRGTIYLPGSTVEANEALTRPREDLYALTITNHETGAHCHLSARTVDSRNEWIHHIRCVCQREAGARHQEQQYLSYRTPSLSDTPISNNVGRTKIVSGNEVSANESSDDKNDPLRLRENDNGIDNNNAAGGQRSKKSAFKETDILILCAPLILYEGLTMMSQFRLAALCFVPASILVLRWVLMQN